MEKIIVLKAPNSKDPVKMEIGFSMSYLLLGPFAALKDGEYKFFILHLFLTLFSFGLFWPLAAFFANKRKLELLISQRGYSPYSEKDAKLLIDLKIKKEVINEDKLNDALKLIKESQQMKEEKQKAKSTSPSSKSEEDMWLH